MAIHAANNLFAEAFIVSGDAVARATDPTRNYIAEVMEVGENFAGETFAVALGNHDYRKDASMSSDEPLPEGCRQEMEAMWLDIADTPPYQSFDIYGYTFILLNTYRGHNDARFFDDEQIVWLEETLLNSSRVILVMHHPVLTDHFRWLFWVPDIVTPSREPVFFDLIKEHRSKIQAVFIGHAHFWMSDFLNRTTPVYLTTSLGEADDYGVHVIGLSKDSLDVRRLFESELATIAGTDRPQ